MSETTHVAFYPLTFAAEPDGVTVGRSDIDSYALLPVDGVELLHQLASGMSIEEAADWYHTAFGERIDMTDFVDTLREFGFVRDGQADNEASGVETSGIWLRRLGNALFSPAAWICYSALVLASLVEMAVHPVLRPNFHNVFFTSSLVAVQLVLALVQMPAVLWHEWFHVLAGRRLGLSTRLGVGRRWYYFVFQTELNGLLSVPRRKRYLPFLAGMVADVLLLCALTLIAAAGLPGGLSWLNRLALAIAYTTLLRLGWQCYLFLRTDLYFVLTTALGCTNLHEATSAYLRARLQRVPGVRPSTTDDQDWSPRDRRIAPWFALITLAGAVFVIAAAIIVVLPMGIEFVRRVSSALSEGMADEGRFWDSLISVVLLIAQFGVLPLLAGRIQKRGDEPSSRIREESL